MLVQNTVNVDLIKEYEEGQLEILIVALETSLNLLQPLYSH